MDGLNRREGVSGTFGGGSGWLLVVVLFRHGEGDSAICVFGGDPERYVGPFQLQLRAGLTMGRSLVATCWRREGMRWQTRCSLRE